MADVDLKTLNEVDFLRRMQASVQKHIANIENVISMMRSGHFIDADQRIKGSREGLIFIKMALEERAVLKAISNESNPNS